MLFFKKRFFDAIAAGEKTTTLRYWRHRRVKPLSVHTVPHLGRVRIDSVETIHRKELRASHARADGFKTLVALRLALKEIYGPEGPRDGKKLYLVRFTYLGKGTLEP